MPLSGERAGPGRLLLLKALLAYEVAGTIALHSSAGEQRDETSASTARFFRNPDPVLAPSADGAQRRSSSELLHIELDSSGKGMLEARHRSVARAAASAREPIDTAALAVSDSVLKASATGPQVVNGGFEQGSGTASYQYAPDVPGWSKLGQGCMFIKTGSAAFQNVQASHGQYLLGLNGEGSGVFQSVGGHTIGKWYRLVFHSAFRSTYGEAKLKVSVDSTEKFNQAVYSGTLGWYEVTYKAPYADVVITFEHSGPAGDRLVYIDGVDIKPVELWDTAHGNAHQVLLQKVTCNGYPSPDTCTRGRFLAVGDYSDDGTSSIVEANSASSAAVWVALHEDNRWSFKSASLVQPSPGGSGPERTGPMWYLHADYTGCEARNWFSRATSSFHVALNGMDLHTLSDVGTECGSLFAIQKFENAETYVVR